MATYRQMLKSAATWQKKTDNWAKSSKLSWFWRYFMWGWLFDKYDVTFIPINEKLEGDGSVVMPKQLLADLIRKSVDRRIVPFCMCRVGCACKEYPMGIGCIFLGEATSQMDPSHGYPATVEQALAHLEKASEAGLTAHVGKIDPDAFWSGIKMEDWDKFISLCFCCDCCCIAMRNKDRWSDEVKTKVHKLEGVQVKVNDACVGCGKCVDRCFTDAIKIVDKKAIIDTDKCKGCGLCIDHCPVDAIDLSVSESDKMVKALYDRIRGYGDRIIGK